MLKKIIDNGWFGFFEEAKDWKDAIRKSCIPLVNTGVIKKSYEEEIVKCIEKHGPYIVIAPLIAIPHSMISNDSVNSCAISFVKFNKIVKFEEDTNEYDAMLFFTLAANNTDNHLENMQKLVDILENDNLIEKLKYANSKEDLIKISNEFNM